MNIQDLAPIAIAFVFIAVVIGVGATVLTSIQDKQTASGFAYNASASGLEGLGELSGWLPTIALVVAAAIVIGVLAYFRSN
jgi:type II secretory pathway component PulF